MTAARIVITQEGSTGAPGLSREDLVLAQPVTLSNYDNSGVRSWRWKLVDIPLGSAATITNAVSAVSSFTPDEPGTYLVELTIDEGKAGQVDRSLAAVLEAVNGVSVRWPAAGETTEANWLVSGAPNTRGWMPAFETLLRTAISGGLFTATTLDSTLRWDGADWVENLLVTASAAGDLAAAGASTLTGAVTCGSTLAVTGTSTLTGAVSCGGTLAVAGGAEIAGGSIAGASTEANELVVGGLGVSSGQGISIQTDASTTQPSWFAFGNSGSALDAGMAYQPSSDSLFFRWGGTSRLQGNSTSFFPTTNGGVTLGSAGLRFGNVHANALTAYGALSATGASTLTGAVTCGSTLAVTGASTLTGAVSCASTLAVAGTSTLTGAVTCGSTLAVAGDSITVGGREVSTELYVQSRGQNLVTNGTGLLGDNTNFSTFTFDGAEVLSGTGGFSVTSGSVTRFTDEYIPVTTTERYRLSTYLKWDGDQQPRHYLGLSFRDVDGNLILPNSHMRQAGTDTVLAAPLTPGDNTITVSDASSWHNSAGASSSLRTVVLWSYSNSFGYTYPDYTYSRQSVVNAYADGGVNAGTGVITLSSAWTFANPDDAAGTWPIGTAISNGSSSNTYKYIAAVGVLTPADWTYYEGEIEGVDLSGTNVTSMFPPGTAAAQVVYLLNRSTTNAQTTWLSNISFGLSEELIRDGTTLDSTLRWDGTDWLENTAVRATAAGNLTATGTSTLTGAVTCASTLAVTGTSTLSGAVTCGSTLAVAGNATLTGTTTYLEAASAVLLLGNNLGSPQIQIRSAGASTGGISFTSTTQDWLLANGATNQDFVLDRYVGGVYGGRPFRVLNSTGEVRIGEAGQLTRVEGNLSATGTSTLTGAVTCASTLAVTGTSTLTGAVTCASTLTGPTLVATTAVRYGSAAGPLHTTGAGTPEGSVTAPVGSTYGNTTNGDQYTKTTGTGNTGWALISSGAATPPLSSVLTAGSTTGGTDVTISNGDAIVGATALNLEAANGRAMSFKGHTAFIGAEKAGFTKAAQLAIAAGVGTSTTIATIASLTNNNSLVSFDITFTIVRNASSDQWQSIRYSGTAHRDSAGTVTLATAHLDSVQKAAGLSGFMANLTFEPIVSGTTIIFRVINSTALDSWTGNYAMHWTTQESGFTS